MSLDARIGCVRVVGDQYKVSLCLKQKENITVRTILIRSCEQADTNKFMKKMTLSDPSHWRNFESCAKV